MARGAKGGDYSREAINRGTAIIQRNTVSQELFHVVFYEFLASYLAFWG